MEFPNLVICGHCGTTQPSAIQLGGHYQRITLWNNHQTCAACGNWIRIPDGVFSSVSEGAKVLAETANSLEVINPLLQALEAIQATPDMSSDELVAALRNTGLRQADALAETAPRQPKDKRVWAAALLTAISYAWESLPQGALSWIELFEKIRAALG